MIAILVILSKTLTYGMTLLFLIAFVYLLFAYQNYLNKKANQDESSKPKVPLTQPSKGQDVPTQERADSFEPPIFRDSEIKAEPLESVTTNEEQQSLNGLSASHQEISSPSNEDKAIDNLGENESIHSENRAVTSLNEVLEDQFESEESLNSSSEILESRQEGIVDLSVGIAADLQEEENKVVSSNAELLEDESNEEHFK